MSAKRSEYVLSNINDKGAVGEGRRPVVALTHK